MMNKLDASVGIESTCNMLVLVALITWLIFWILGKMSGYGKALMVCIIFWAIAFMIWRHYGAI